MTLELQNAENSFKVFVAQVIFFLVLSYIISLVNTDDAGCVMMGHCCSFAFIQNLAKKYDAPNSPPHPHPPLRNPGSPHAGRDRYKVTYLHRRLSTGTFYRELVGHSSVRIGAFFCLPLLGDSPNGISNALKLNSLKFILGRKFPFTNSPQCCTFYTGLYDHGIWDFALGSLSDPQPQCIPCIVPANLGRT